MCTVSWQHHADGYDLFFSRDEQRSRALGQPPREHGGDGTRWLAPRDPQGGGSWIVANSHGLTVCLLNAYDIDPQPHRAPNTDRPARARSRGWLPVELAAARNLADCQRRLQRVLTLATFAPCLLLCLQPRGTVACWQWTGSMLHRIGDPVRPPLTTSSHESDRVTRSRHAVFDLTAASGAPSVEQLRRYHECPDQAADASTVRMSRPDARTVSLTHVQVRDREVAMAYAARDGDGGFDSALRRSTPRTRVRFQALETAP